MDFEFDILSVKGKKTNENKTLSFELFNNLTSEKEILVLDVESEIVKNKCYDYFSRFGVTLGSNYKEWSVSEFFFKFTSEYHMNRVSSGYSSDTTVTIVVIANGKKFVSRLDDKMTKELIIQYKDEYQ